MLVLGSEASVPLLSFGCSENCSDLPLLLLLESKVPMQGSGCSEYCPASVLMLVLGREASMQLVSSVCQNIVMHLS